LIVITLIEKIILLTYLWNINIVSVGLIEYI